MLSNASHCSLAGIFFAHDGLPMTALKRAKNPFFKNVEMGSFSCFRPNYHYDRIQAFCGVL